MQKFLNCFLFSIIIGSNVSEEEKIQKKVKPKSSVSRKGAATGKNSSAKIIKAISKPKVSKYFESPVKEEEDNDSEDDFDIVTPAAPADPAKMEKDEEEEDSEEDEGDWEEVEGLFTRIYVGIVEGADVLPKKKV